MDIAKIKEIRVVDIYLQEDNPRHDPLSSQEDIISVLLRDERVRNLARDISILGETSPMEIPGVVINSDGQYVVVEGNRRVCALILLNNPSRCPSGERAYFEGLASKATAIPKTIFCYVFDDYKSAKPWIDRRHNGEQEGVGIKSWDARQKARAQENPRDAIAYTLIKYAAEKKLWHSSNSRSKSVLTTASRYFSNPKFRSDFGIVSGPREKDVKIGVQVKGFDRALKQFLTDISTKNSGVDSRQNVKSIESYSKKLLGGKKSLVPSRSIRDVASGVTGTGNAGRNKGKGADSKNNPSPDTRKYVIPSSVKVSIVSPILKRIFDEARGVNNEKHTLASVMVLRCFLENVYADYIELVCKQSAPSKTHMKIKMVVQALETIKAKLSRDEKKALTAIKKAGNQQDHLLSGDTLGFFVHGGAYPDRVQLNRHWDNVQAIILFMLSEIKEAVESKK